MSDLLVLASGGDDWTGPRATIQLRRVALPLAGNQRIQWRIISILIALDCCRGSSATIEQLHTLVWALQEEENARNLFAAWHERGRTFRGYVPDLLSTLRVMQIDGLVEQNGAGRQVATAAGQQVRKAFKEAGGSLGKQEDVLGELAPIATAAMWRALEGKI